MGVGPRIQSLATKLRPIIDEDAFGNPIADNEVLQVADHPLTRQGGVHLDRQAFSGHGIQDVEQAESPPIGQYRGKRVSC
jgi:hypothetical protein